MPATPARRALAALITASALASGALAGCAPDSGDVPEALGTEAAALRTTLAPRTTEPTRPAPTEPVPTEPAPTEPAPTEPAPQRMPARRPILVPMPEQPVGLDIDPTVSRYPWGPVFDSAAAAADCATDSGPRWWCGGRERDGVVDPDACPDTTWLAFRLADPPCPDVDGFVLEAPFAASLHPDLDRVCRYTWTVPGAPPAVDLLPDNATLRVERDCRVVGGHAVPEQVWRPLEAAWFTQLSLPDYSADPVPSVGTTRVAVLDSSPGGGVVGGPSPGQTSSHGLAIGGAIRAIACPAARDADGPCAAALDHHIALPRAEGDEKPPRGGAYGTQGEFADAVVAALTAWKAAPSTAPLIINLSIGWTPMHGGDVADRRRFTPMAGLWALDLAACQGALAIAASGNRSGVDGTGATYPAAWTAEPSLCDATRPPVYAAGGVDGRDLPISLGRPGSLPRLLVPASQVIVADERFGQPAGLVPLSGTSLAAAATSAAAALVWAWRPDFDAAQVMETLYAAAAPIDGFAEVDLNGAVPRRRLDTCAALTLACVGGICAAPPPACPGRPEDARADAAALLGLMHSAAVDIVGPAAMLGLGVDVNDAPYAVPQPTVTQCPFCGISGGLLYGTLVSTPGAVLVGAVLHIDDGIAGVSIPLPNLPEATPFKLPIGYNGEIKGAWLEGQLFINGKFVETASEIVVVD